MLAGNDKDLRAKALDAANKPTPVSPAPTNAPSLPTTSSVSAPAPVAVSPSINAAPAPVAGFGGKLAPPPAPQPEI